MIPKFLSQAHYAFLLAFGLWRAAWQGLGLANTVWRLSCTVAGVGGGHGISVG